MRRTALFFLLPAFGALPVIAQQVPGYAIPNSKHYRESGVGNASGRTGTAQMTARALLGEDGNTTIEVTTGALDATTPPPGSFKKVQFKPLDPDGDAMFAQNFMPLSSDPGYYTFIAPSLYRHQQAQIQGNIVGIDNRTDVVTVVDTVKLRPDLAIQNFHLPDSVFVNTTVNIVANIAELNGDTPATADCQLSVNGVLVDRASKIFVDAAGSVSCAFAYTFKSTGAQTIQATVAGVTPADWDTANNSASGTINVVDPITNAAEHGTATFTDQTGGFPYSSTTSEFVTKNGLTYFQLSNTTGTSGETQDADTSFYSGPGCVGNTNAASYQFPVDITYTETMDGAPVYSTKATGLTGSSSTTAVNLPLCGSTAVSYVQQMGSALADDYTINFSSYTYYDSASKPLQTYQQVNSTRNAGTVTYLSAGYECQRWAANCNTDATNFYTWNTHTPNQLGTLIGLGSTWTPSITVTDASGNGFGGSLPVPLSTSQVTAGNPNTCTPPTAPNSFGYSFQYCNSSSTDYTLTQGSVTY